MGIVIVKNPWVMKKVTLSDGSAVFNLESREIPGTVVRLACVDEGKADLLQMALGEAVSYMELDDNRAAPFKAPFKSLHEQASEVAINAAAVLCGAAAPGDFGPVATPMFRNTLREIPELGGNFTIGDIARAYLAAALAQLTSSAKAP